MITEEWKPVLDWPEYEISNLGNVRSRRGAIRTFAVDGYLSFNACKGSKRRSLRVHREVLRAFIGDEPDLMALHNDGVPANCILSNLRWGTRLDNELDKKKHGTSLDGARHHQAKLTESQVAEIRSSQEKRAILAIRFGVSARQIWTIRTGRSWRHSN